MARDAKQSTARTGTDHSMMRELNRSLVLDLIKQRSPISRAAIAAEISLAKPTVSAIVEELIGEGLVREIGEGPTSPGGGRRPLLLEFNARAQFVVGVQIGINRTRVVVADALGRELDRDHIATPSGAPEKALQRIAKAIDDLMKRAGAARRRLAAVGMCVPGLIEKDTGVCLLAPNLGWHDVPVREILERALVAPSYRSAKVPVYVVNTADAAVVVENTEGAAQGVSHVVMLYVIGFGVGSATVTDGKLMHGSRGLHGEIGHCHVPGATTRCNCGKIGCLETLTDGRAIVRAAKEAIETGRDTSLSRVPVDELTARHVGDAAAEGDAVALEILAEVGRLLGLAASWLINLLNPDVLIVGGGVANAGEPLLGPLREAAYEHTLPQEAERVEIRPWSGNNAAAMGAIRVALQNSETYYRVVSQG